MPTYHGLYYPYIHFQNEGWLKVAALYWDGMYRIVPPEMLTNDSDEVKRLEQGGFISRVHPYGAAQEIAGPFRQLLQSRGKALKEKFGIGSLPGRLGHAFLGTGDEISYISDSKIVYNLLTDLRHLSLVVLKEKDDDIGHWVGMHRELARVYMTALAETIAPTIGARPLADNPFDHVAISGVTMERLVDILLASKEHEPDNNLEIEGSIATIAFRQIIPREINNIPASDIIKFRKEHPEERTQFHDEITKILKDMDYLRKIESPEEVARRLEDAYKNRLKGKLERLEKAMRRANWDVAESALAATWAVPAGLAAALAGLGVVLSTAGGAAIGIAIGGWTLWRKREKANADALKPSAEAYLYHAKRFFSVQELVREVETDSSGLIRYI
jgi:hypothetical protein